jgi:hypothetical protein
LVATNPANGQCHEANKMQAAFVQGAVIDPANGQISIYNPLVIDNGTKAAVKPTMPALPAGGVVALWFGFNGNNLTLKGAGAGKALTQGNCVNGAANSIFGQFSYCNAPAFFTAANQAIQAGTLVIPALGMAKDGMPCPTVRDFSVVDQDQSDNVTTSYLVNGNGQVAQNTTANAATLANAGAGMKMQAPGMTNPVVGGQNQGMNQGQNQNQQGMNQGQTQNQQGMNQGQAQAQTQTQGQNQGQNQQTTNQAQNQNQQGMNQGQAQNQTQGQNQNQGQAQAQPQAQAPTTQTNASDNRLLAVALDGALGCTPFMAPDLANNGAITTALPLDELQAAAQQKAPIALIPANDPMVLNNGQVDMNKVNLYRAGVNQPAAQAAADASTTTYCTNLLNTAPARLQLDSQFTMAAASPDPAVANSLFTFLAQRFSATFGPNNLNCQGLLNVQNPINLTLTNGVATAAAITVPNANANAGNNGNGMNNGGNAGNGANGNGTTGNGNGTNTGTNGNTGTGTNNGTNTGTGTTGNTGTGTGTTGNTGTGNGNGQTQPTATPTQQGTPTPQN